MNHVDGTTAAGRLRGEQGSATMLAVVGMLILAIVTTSLISLAGFEGQIALNHVQEVRAVQAAESGARHVFRQMRNNTPQNGTYWLTQSQPMQNAVAVDPAGTATYTVHIVDNNDGDGTLAADKDGVVIIRSVGRAGGATYTVGLRVSTGPYVPNNAIAANDKLAITGSPNIGGNCGSVYVAVTPASTETPPNLSISPGAFIQQGASTSGTASGSYAPPAGTAPETGVAANPVPAVVPAAFTKYADYVLTDNNAYRWKAGAQDPGTGCPPMPSACNPGDFGWQLATGPLDPKWNLDSGEWRPQGSSARPGTYYVRGNARLDATPGTGVPPNTYRVTVITTGYIYATGSHLAAANYTAAAPNINPLGSPPNVLFVAGTDLKIDSPHIYNSLMLAHEQLDLGGSTTVSEGAFVIENGGVTSLYVTSSRVSGGSLTVTYNCGLLAPGLIGSPTVLGWMRL